MEDKAIPPHFDYAGDPQLRAEAREKLARVRPASLGQAGRISGISPADLAVLFLCIWNSRELWAVRMAEAEPPVNAGQSGEKNRIPELWRIDKETEARFRR